MFDLLLSGPLLWGGVGIVAVGLFAWFFYRKGKLAERAKVDAARHRARDIADEVDDAVAGRSPSENRDRLKRWARGEKP